MKYFKIYFTLLILTKINCIGQDSSNKKETNFHPVQLESNDLYNVSLVKLIATPEKYDGKTIQVVGFLNLEFEGTAIYFHKEDYENGLNSNGFWVDFSKVIKSEKNLNDYNKSYVIIIGTFDMNAKGHMGLFGGTFKNITRLDKWHSR